MASITIQVCTVLSMWLILEVSFTSTQGGTDAITQLRVYTEEHLPGYQTALNLKEKLVNMTGQLVDALKELETEKKAGQPLSHSVANKTLRLLDDLQSGGIQFAKLEFSNAVSVAKGYFPALRVRAEIKRETNLE